MAEQHAEHGTKERKTWRRAAVGRTSASLTALALLVTGCASGETTTEARPTGVAAAANALTPSPTPSNSPELEAALQTLREPTDSSLNEFSVNNGKASALLADAYETGDLTIFREGCYTWNEAKHAAEFNRIAAALVLSRAQELLIDDIDPSAPSDTLQLTPDPYNVGRLYHRLFALAVVDEAFVKKYTTELQQIKKECTDPIKPVTPELDASVLNPSRNLMYLREIPVSAELPNNSELWQGMQDVADYKNIIAEHDNNGNGRIDADDEDYAYVGTEDIRAENVRIIHGELYAATIQYIEDGFRTSNLSTLTQS